jgi:hypothetical protein
VLSHGHSDVELSTDQHAHGIDHDDHDMSFDGDDFGSPSDQDDSSRGEHAHVHAFSQFTPSVEIAASVELVAYAEIVRPIETTAAISHSSYPPLRPPRTIL